MIGEAFIASDDHATAPRGDDLVTVEGVATEITDCAYLSAGQRSRYPPGTQRLGSIFDYPYAVLLAEFEEGSHVRWMAKNMNDLDDLRNFLTESGTPVHFFQEQLGVHIPSLGLAVDKQ